MSKLFKKPKTPGPSAHEKALAKDSATRWNDYVTRYVPVENEFIKRTKATQDKVAAAQGLVNADAGMAYGELREQMDAGLSSQTAAPGTGRSVMGGADLAGTYAEASGAGQAGMEQAVHDQEQGATVKMSAFGRGLQDQTALGLGNAARTAQHAVMGSFERGIAKNNFTRDTLIGLGAFGASKFAPKTGTTVPKMSMGNVGLSTAQQGLADFLKKG